MGSLLRDDTVAEEVKLGGAGEAFGVGDPAGGEAHHPFDEVGGESSGARLGG